MYIWLNQQQRNPFPNWSQNAILAYITSYHFFMLLAVSWRGILAVHLHVLVSPLFWLNFSHKRQTKDPEDPRSSAKVMCWVVAKLLPTAVMSHAMGHGLVIICQYGRTQQEHHCCFLSMLKADLARDRPLAWHSNPRESLLSTLFIAWHDQDMILF